MAGVSCKIAGVRRSRCSVSGATSTTSTASTKSRCSRPRRFVYTSIYSAWMPLRYARGSQYRYGGWMLTVWGHADPPVDPRPGLAVLGEMGHLAGEPSQLCFVLLLVLHDCFWIGLNAHKAPEHLLIMIIASCVWMFRGLSIDSRNMCVARQIFFLFYTAYTVPLRTGFHLTGMCNRPPLNCCLTCVPHVLPTEPGILEIGWLREGTRTCDSQVRVPG
eukprot:COSAG05_NODE_1747_length_4151_cov_4.600197_1_plen_218_part_00